MNAERIRAASANSGRATRGLLYFNMEQITELLGFAANEALEQAAAHLKGEAEREATGARHLYLDQAATMVLAQRVKP